MKHAARYENFTVDMKDEGNNRTDLESLVQLMDRCDRAWAPARTSAIQGQLWTASIRIYSLKDFPFPEEDWTCSGTLFFTLYAILTGIRHALLIRRLILFYLFSG